LKTTSLAGQSIASTRTKRQGVVGSPDFATSTILMAGADKEDTDHPTKNQAQLRYFLMPGFESVIFTLLPLP